MKLSGATALPFLLLFGAIPGLLSATAKAAGSPDDLRTGFFLLRNVCHEETEVHLITTVKTTPEDVTDYVNRVSKIADDSMKSIEEMEDRDKALKLEKNPLPAFEQTVRSGIRDDKQHQLLFGTSGPAFARALLVTQLEASNYISHIAKALADEDPSAQDTRALLKISSRWARLREEGFRLLGAP